MHDLMVRGGAPTSVAEARNSSDVALLRLAMLAAVGSCSLPKTYLRLRAFVYLVLLCLVPMLHFGTSTLLLFYSMVVCSVVLRPFPQAGSVVYNTKFQRALRLGVVDPLFNRSAS